MKVIYVTGCLGFIGSYVTRECLKKGWYIRGIDKMTYAANQELLAEFSEYENFEFEQKDIYDLEFLYDCDYVINTAAETHVGNSIVHSDDFIHSNINGVHNLLELIRNHRQEGQQVPTLLHFSTDEVYGDIESGAHIETDLLKPSNPYSATKAAADMLVTAWARTYDVPYVIIRPTNNYGIGQYVEKFIPKAIKNLSLGRPIIMHDNGSPSRTWLHVSDTANAVIKIIQSGTVNEVYNISGNYEEQNIIVAKKLIDLFFNWNVIHYTEFMDFSEKRIGQDVRYAIDDSKLKALGWKPEAEFNDALVDIVKYYKENFIW